MANRGEPWRFEKPWRGTARFVVRFAKKPNRAVVGRFAVRQDTNRTVAVRCGPCEPPRFVEPWSTLAAGALPVLSSSESTAHIAVLSLAGSATGALPVLSSSASRFALL